MRPRYETQADRQRQRRAMEVFCGMFQCGATATPDLAGWDYEVDRNGSTVALVEVKCRLCNHRTYPTYMVSLRKVADLRDEAARRGIDALVLVAWQDRTGFVHAHAALEHGFVMHGGRVDRGDPMDMEEMLHVPIDRFRML